MKNKKTRFGYKNLQKGTTLSCLLNKKQREYYAKIPASHRTVFLNPTLSTWRLVLKYLKGQQVKKTGSVYWYNKLNSILLDIYETVKLIMLEYVDEDATDVEMVRIFNENIVRYLDFMNRV